MLNLKQIIHRWNFVIATGVFYMSFSTSASNAITQLHRRVVRIVQIFVPDRILIDKVFGLYNCNSLSKYPRFVGMSLFVCLVLGFKFALTLVWNEVAFWRSQLPPPLYCVICYTVLFYKYTGLTRVSKPKTIKLSEMDPFYSYVSTATSLVWNINWRGKICIHIISSIVWCCGHCFRKRSVVTNILQIYSLHTIHATQNMMLQSLWLNILLYKRTHYEHR